MLTDFNVSFFFFSDVFQLILGEMVVHLNNITDVCLGLSLTAQNLESFGSSAFSIKESYQHKKHILQTVNH